MDINLIAPINYLGYGVVGYNVFKTLLQRGHNVALFPIGEPKFTGDPRLGEEIKTAISRARFYNPSAPSIRIWHQHELDMFPGRGMRIGWPIFELNKFDDKEKHQMEAVDKLFVCSQWAKDILVKENIKHPDNIHVVPLGVNQEHFFFDPMEKQRRPYWTKNTTIFINVGKWEVRKGHNELLEAFNKAFKPGDDVELWMINRNDFIRNEGNDEWKRKYANSPMGAHIKFFPRLDTQAHLRQLFHHVDCGVFPSHAEGWNLEIPELMACGSFIIATNYSGHTEFVNNDNSLLVEPNGMELAKDGIWFHGQGEWCSFSVDELANKMKEFDAIKKFGKAEVNVAGIETALKLTWHNTIETVERILS